MNLDTLKFGHSIGVLTLLKTEGSAEIEKCLTLFELKGDSIDLVKQIDKFDNRTIESTDTVIVCFIDSSSKARSFNIDDYIEQSLLDKVLASESCISTIDVQSNVYVSGVSQVNINSLKENYKVVCKESHFNYFGWSGLFNLSEIVEIPVEELKRITSDYSSFHDYSLIIDRKDYNLKALNALGIVLGICKLSNINSNVAFANEKNILKSSAKRTLFKLLPVVLFILIVNYFFANWQNEQIANLEYEDLLTQKVLGEVLTTNEKQISENEFKVSILESLRFKRSVLLNQLINLQLDGIVYKQLTINPYNKLGPIMEGQYGNIELQFETIQPALISEWLNGINNSTYFHGGQLIELSTDREGIAKGVLMIRYD